MSLGIYGPDPAYFLSAPELAWQTTLKKAKSKIRSIKVYWYVISGRKSYKVEHAMLYWYAKANNKYIKDYDKKENLRFLTVRT